VNSITVITDLKKIDPFSLKKSNNCDWERIFSPELSLAQDDLTTVNLALKQSLGAPYFD